MNGNELYQLKEESIGLLKQLIALPSFSREEDATAALIVAYLEQHGVKARRFLNNVWAMNEAFDAKLPTILLNSHHDTVRPNSGYTIDPFLPVEKDGKLFGLGSNDAGASLVSLVATFLYFNKLNGLKYNVVLAATAEEEISGSGGIESLLPQLPGIEFAIVGEPTRMQMAVAERGLLVLDAVAKGKAGHAARGEGDNALYKAMDDVQALQQLKFEKESDLLGPVKATVTVIETVNKAHNVVPDECRFVVDVRVNEMYTLEEVLDTIRKKCKSEFKPRSLRLKPSSIPVSHPLVQSGLSLGKTMYGSPTTSDKALMPFPALKIGPGDSARSHTADEYVHIDEIFNGIDDYIKILKRLL